MNSTLPTNGTLTSAMAAEDAAPNAANIRDRLHALILKQGLRGATAEELEHVTGIKGNTIRPRLLELRGIPERKLPVRIVTLGEQRLTASGSKATVWIAAAEDRS